MHSLILKIFSTHSFIIGPIVHIGLVVEVGLKLLTSFK